jgi:hypothetical protein
MSSERRDGLYRHEVELRQEGEKGVTRGRDPRQLRGLPESRPGSREALLDDNLAFTSPQDDHIDRQTFLERCFPTAGRVARQDLIHVTRASETDVFICYEYELKTGATHRNTELITVVDGRVTEIQVFFGGAVA